MERMTFYTMVISDYLKEQKNLEIILLLVLLQMILIKLVEKLMFSNL